MSDKLLADLGIDGKGTLTDKAKGEKLVTGIKTLFRHFFGSKKETTNAHLLGKMLVDGDIFGAQASKEVSSIIARTYTRSVFSPWRILKAMDSKCQGSFNDSAVRDYAHIEKEASDVKYKRGASLLPDRNGIVIARKVLDNIIDPILGVRHNANATKSQHGDHVQVHH